MDINDIFLIIFGMVVAIPITHWIMKEETDEEFYWRIDDRKNTTCLKLQEYDAKGDLIHALKCLKKEFKYCAKKSKIFENNSENKIAIINEYVQFLAQEMSVRTEAITKEIVDSICGVVNEAMNKEDVSEEEVRIMKSLVDGLKGEIAAPKEKDDKNE